MLMDVLIVTGTSAAVIGLEKAVRDACRKELSLSKKGRRHVG